MAIENVVVSFYNTVAGSVSGKFLNQYPDGDSAGLLDADLDGYDTGDPTGISFTLGSDRVGAAAGRAAGATTLIEQVNTQGWYHTGSSLVDFFTVPAEVVSCDVVVHLCTEFPNQTSLDVDVNGTAQNDFDSSGNTTGAVLTFTDVEPDGDNQINITISGTGSGFIYVNGYQLTNIDDSGGSGGDPNLNLISGKLGALLMGKL